MGARGGVQGARGATAETGSTGSPRARGRVVGSAGTSGMCFRASRCARRHPRGRADARRAHHQNPLHPRAPAVARCGKNAGRVSLVGSRRCARETNGSPESGSASGHQRVRDATHHFALVLVADGDVGVLHGHVLLHELALRLGLVGSLGGGLGDRRDDDGAARLDGLAPGAEASLWMTRWTGGRGVRLGFEACAERRLRASRSAGEIVPSGSASTPSRAPANARGGRREGCAPGRQGPERPWQTWRTCYDVRNLTRRGVRASARREVGLVWRVCPSTATATDKSRRAEGGEERSHPKPGGGERSPSFVWEISHRFCHDMR